MCSFFFFFLLIPHRNVEKIYGLAAKESEEFDSVNIYELIIQHQTNSLTSLRQDLANVESTIQKIIREDEHLNRLFKWTKEPT